MTSFTVLVWPVLSASVCIACSTLVAIILLHKAARGKRVLIGLLGAGFAEAANKIYFIVSLHRGTYIPQFRDFRAVPALLELVCLGFLVWGFREELAIRCVEPDTKATVADQIFKEDSQMAADNVTFITDKVHREIAESFSHGRMVASGK